MPKLKILVWEKKREPIGEPDVEVIIPSYMAKWAPRMMRLMPREARQELWGDDFNLSELNLDEMIFCIWLAVAVLSNFLQNWLYNNSEKLFVEDYYPMDNLTLPNVITKPIRKGNLS